MPRPDRREDAALIAAMARSEPGASEVFVRRFHHRVHHLAMSVLQDHDLASDVAQEVFIRAWKAAATYDAQRASALTWLLRITRNAAIDAARKHRSRPTEDHELEQLLHAREPAAELVHDAALDRLAGQQALHSLSASSPGQARAVALSVLAGRTAAEVAAHEGIPLGTAKTRIRTGLRRLREIVETHP